MNDSEETIDLGRLFGIAWAHKKRVGTIIIACTVVFLLLALVLPKKYESTTLVQTRSTGRDLSGTAGAALAMLGGASTTNLTTNYIELMKSRTVLDPIIDSIDWEDEDKKPEAKDFAKAYLTIENTKQTNLISVTAKGKTPEQAQEISKAVVDNFLDLQTNKSKQTQSLLVQFLNERIDEAKKDADEASTAFADYQREHKIYSPEEQAKAIVSQTKAFDEAIANMKVQQQANAAKLDAVNSELGDQQSRALAYGIMDNENIQKLRDAIISKQVEIVGLLQTHTEKHPAVIQAREQLAELQRGINGEVQAAVQSKTVSLNPTQASLVSQQAATIISQAVTDASIDAIQKRRDEKEKEMGDFPTDVLNYMQLQRDAAIKNEIYTSLVKQCEQNKIQEAMDSMDIQVIDEANLPREDRPSFPKKKIFAALGFVIGCLGAFGYTFMLYKREG